MRRSELSQVQGKENTHPADLGELDHCLSVVVFFSPKPLTEYKALLPLSKCSQTDTCLKSVVSVLRDVMLTH